MSAKILLFIGVGILAGIEIIGMLNMRMTLFNNYYINESPEELATRLSKEHRPAEKCLNLIVLDILPGPSVISQRSTCLYYFAKLTKDPAVCELLLPSNYDYGMRCLAEVHDKIITEDRCASDGKALYCKKGVNDPNGRAGAIEQFPVPDVRACQEISSSAIRDWCFSERVTRGISDDDCSAVTAHSQRHDDCLRFLAIRKKDPELCAPIEDNNLRALCKVHVRARKYSNTSPNETWRRLLELLARVW